MDAVFKNENVYVVVKNKEFRDDVNLNNFENLILCRSLKYKNSLYGGRVYLNYNFGQGYGWLEVDGISIKQYNCSTAGKIDSTSTHSLEQIVAHLNQIENLGVDSFLENYKAQLQELKKEFEKMIEDMQQDLAIKYDEEKASTIELLNKVVLSMTCLIFSLLINMNAGLQNHDYTNAYDTIINLYF